MCWLYIYITKDHNGVTHLCSGIADGLVQVGQEGATELVVGKHQSNREMVEYDEYPDCNRHDLVAQAFRLRVALECVSLPRRPTGSASLPLDGATASHRCPVFPRITSFISTKYHSCFISTQFLLGCYPPFLLSGHNIVAWCQHFCLRFAIY